MAVRNVRTGCRGGFSLVEAIIAMMVVAIAILGTMSLRYQSTIDTKRAELGSNAARLALAFIESWRGVAGSDTFDPVTYFSSDLTIETEQGPSEPGGFTLLGKYRVELNSVNYYATLSYQDINADLRELNTIVSWEQRGVEDIEADQTDKTFALSIYVEK